MISVEVVSEEKNWSKKIKKKEVFFHSICKSFPKKYQFINKKIFLTLLLSNNKGTKKLNKQFRNKNKTTDILSFPFHKKKDLDKLIKSKQKQIYLGDIIINVNKISNNLNKKIFLEKFDIIWIHGLTHLLGYKHKLNYDYLIMNRFEKRLLKILS